MNPSLVAAALALLRPGAVQDPAQQPEILDCAAAQIGDELITLSELSRANERMLRSRTVSTREEAQQVAVQGLRDLVIEHLEVQAGEDMGLDPTQVEQQVRAILRDEQSRLGIADYTEQLLGRGSDALTAHTDKQREIYGWLWRRSEVGTPLFGQRPSFDRYIRPGELHSFYEENRSALFPARVRLQMLIVSSAAAGGPDEARRICEECRERVLAGEDLGSLVAEYGASYRETDGMTDLEVPAALRDPVLRAFAKRAEPDELSEVLPLLNPRDRPDPGLGYQLARLHERQEGEVVEYESPELQRNLRGFYTRMRTERVLGRERSRLQQQSYTWVHPRLPGLPQSPPPVSPP